MPRLGLGIVAACLVLCTVTAEAADTLHVGVGAIYPPYSIPFAAKDLGLYAQNGLDVEVTAYRGSPQEALVSGLADIITAPPHAVSLAISKGIKEQIFAFDGEVQPSGWHLMVMNDSPYKTVADLAGKKVGVGAKGSATDLMALLALSLSKVKASTIPMGTQEIMGTLKARQIDAGITGPIPGYKVLVTGLYRPVFSFDNLKDPHVFNGWVSPVALIDSRPDALRRWMKANKAAILYMQGHEDWTLGFLKRYADEEDDRVVKSFYDDIIKNLKADQIIQPEWLATELSFATESGIQKLLSADKIYTDKIATLAAQN